MSPSVPDPLFSMKASVPFVRVTALAELAWRTPFSQMLIPFRPATNAHAFVPAVVVGVTESVLPLAPNRKYTLPSPQGIEPLMSVPLVAVCDPHATLLRAVASSLWSTIRTVARCVGIIVSSGDGTNWILLLLAFVNEIPNAAPFTGAPVLYLCPLT